MTTVIVTILMALALGCFLYAALHAMGLDKIEQDRREREDRQRDERND